VTQQAPKALLQAIAAAIALAAVTVAKQVTNPASQLPKQLASAVSSWDAARTRNEVEARRRMRRIGHILEILKVRWRYLIAERSHCSIIV
jgi:hypothetical protein